MDKIKKLYSNDYIALIFFALIIVVTTTLYHYSTLIWTIAVVIYAVIIFVFIISGKFKLAWDYIKFILLGFLVAVILTLAHIDVFPWSIPFYIIGFFILITLDADREPDEYLLKYITEMRTLGLSDTQITLNLHKANWKTKDIHKAFKYLSKVYEHKK